MRRLLLTSLIILLAVTSVLTSIPEAKAVSVVSIGNGPELMDGSYRNAQNIADQLTLTSIVILAANSINIVDDIDLSTSIFGVPAFDFSLIAPTINLNHNMNMSSFGNLFLSVNTMNLNGQITSAGMIMNPARIFGTATQANVLSNAGSIQQAIDLSSKTAIGVTVHVSAGQYHENLAISKSMTLKGNDGTAEAGADPSAPEIFGAQAGGNVITVTANNVAIDGLHLQATVAAGALTNSANGIYASGVDLLTISQNTLEGFLGS